MQYTRSHHDLIKSSLTTPGHYFTRFRCKQTNSHIAMDNEGIACLIRHVLLFLSQCYMVYLTSYNLHDDAGRKLSINICMTVRCLNNSCLFSTLFVLHVVCSPRCLFSSYHSRLWFFLNDILLGVFSQLISRVLR